MDAPRPLGQPRLRFEDLCKKDSVNIFSIDMASWIDVASNRLCGTRVVEREESKEKEEQQGSSTASASASSASPVPYSHIIWGKDCRLGIELFSHL